MTAPEPPDLRRLDERLTAAKTQGKRGRRQTDNQGMGVGLRIAVELLSAIAIGALAGLGLDRWLGTGPWLLILFFLLGSTAGFLNVIRVSRSMDVERRKKKNEPEA